LVEIPKVFIRKAQGRCRAAKEVMADVLSRSVEEASRRNGGGDGNGGAYRDDAPATEGGQQRFAVAGEVYEDRGLSTVAISSTALPPSQAHHTTSRAKEKGKLDVKQEDEGWRVRRKRMLGVPAFASPLTKILSPVVTRAQWEIVIRSGILAFVISSVVLGVLVAVPVP
jgi:hypothetical protein